jgi:hypothetical protein
VLIRLSQPTPAHENRRVNVQTLGKNSVECSPSSRSTGRRTFDAVFAHDAVSYVIAEDDLHAAFATAFVHPRAGGAALFEPDHVRRPTPVPPTTRATTNPTGGRSATCSGHRPGPRRHLVHRRMRPPAARARRTTRLVHDAHRLSLFPRATWLRRPVESGFVDVRVVQSPHDDDVDTQGFLGVNPR